MVAFWARSGIQKKIFAALAAIVILMAGLFAANLAAERTQSALADRLVRQLIPARSSVRNVKRLIVAADDDGAWYLLEENAAARRAALTRYRSQVGQIDSWLRATVEAAVANEERAALRVFSTAWRAYLRGNEGAFMLARRGNVPQARTAYVRVSFSPVVAALSSYEHIIQAQIDDAEVTRARVRSRTLAASSALSFAALSLAVTVAVRFGGSMRRRLGRVSSAIAEVVHTDLTQVGESFRNIAQGNLSAPRYACARTPIDDGQADEIALLAHSYNGLILGLREMAHRIDESVLEARRRREAEERLAYLRDYDERTGLANRNLLHAQLGRAIFSMRHDGAMLAVVSVGISSLQKIEDSYGHRFAERVFRDAAERLARALGERDIPARGGEDEFVVVFNPVMGRADAEQRARSVIEELARPFVIDERQVLLRPSAGVSVYPSDGEDADELLRNANTAMSYARTAGGGHVQLYAAQLRTQTLARLTIESELEHALSASEFELYYQPIVRVGTRRVEHFEALLRWRHPRLGLLEPASFIDVAEDSTTIEAIGMWVLQTACDQVQAWRRDGHEVGVSVNVSTRQFRGDLFGIVQRALTQTQYPPNALELELTESLMLTGKDAAEVLSSLKRLGVRLALDDFGTGYSSFAYLREFPLDTLKIDRSFVSDITARAYDEAIARAIILLGHSLGFAVVAEGVENVRQAAVLQRLGCDAMQGYFFGRPVPADEALRALRTASLEP
jgi:diguanylate cyclase (GGDEF)-like protein